MRSALGKRIIRESSGEISGDNLGKKLDIPYCGNACLRLGTPSIDSIDFGVAGSPAEMYDRRARGDCMLSRDLLGFVLTAAVAIFPQIIAAQARGMGGGVRGMHGSGGTRGMHGARLTRGERRGSYGGYLFYPWSDYYDDDYDSNNEPPEVSRNVVREPAPKVTVAAATKPVESLVLENRGGQWVRIPSASQMPVAQENAEPQGPGSGTVAPPDKLPPAVLVFRDGHEEQVARYVVQGNVLYTSSDYWSTGLWTRKIPITALDVPATEKLNAARGGAFALPSRPNEVVVRF